MVKLRTTRKLFYVRSKHDELVTAKTAWMKSFRRRVACADGAIHPGKAWRKRPVPIDVVLADQPRGSVAGVFGVQITVVSLELYKVLRPHLEDILVGQVTCPGTVKGKSFVSLVVLPERAIDPYRGAAAVHTQCPHCGLISSEVMNDNAEGIAECVLDQRQIYADHGSKLFVDEHLVRSARLRERFPDLRFQRWPVVPRPLDGDVLPGDPEWDGVFRPQTEKLEAYERSLPKVSEEDMEWARKILEERDNGRS